MKNTNQQGLNTSGLGEEVSTTENKSISVTKKDSKNSIQELLEGKTDIILANLLDVLDLMTGMGWKISYESDTFFGGSEKYLKLTILPPKNNIIDLKINENKEVEIYLNGELI